MTLIPFDENKLQISVNVFYDWKDIINVKNLIRNQIESRKIADISVFDDLINFHGDWHRIVQAFSH